MTAELMYRHATDMLGRRSCYYRLSACMMFIDVCHGWKKDVVPAAAAVAVSLWLPVLAPAVSCHGITRPTPPPHSCNCDVGHVR